MIGDEGQNANVSFLRKPFSYLSISTPLNLSITQRPFWPPGSINAYSSFQSGQNLEGPLIHYCQTLGFWCDVSVSKYPWQCMINTGFIQPHIVTTGVVYPVARSQNSLCAGSLFVMVRPFSQCTRHVKYTDLTVSQELGSALDCVLCQ